jgi:Putative Ig domain
VREDLAHLSSFEPPPATFRRADSGGALSGTPTTIGTSTFSVRVKDADNATATQSYTVTVQSGAAAVTSTR